jgi:hypothetical protein
MSFDHLLYALGGLLLFAATLMLHIRLERARRRREAAMTPEERRELEISAKAARGWAGI